MMNSHQGNPFVDTLSERIGSVANFDTTRLYNVFTYLQTSFGSLLTSLARRGEFKVSHSWAFHPNFCFFFWLKLPKTKIGCVIFCTMFSVCKARQARQKWKIMNKLINYYVIFSFFVTFISQNKKRKMGSKAHKA